MTVEVCGRECVRVCAVQRGEAQLDPDIYTILVHPKRSGHADALRHRTRSSFAVGVANGRMQSEW